MHQQEIIPSNNTVESESNTPSDSTINLIISDNPTETFPTSPNIPITNESSLLNNQDDDQKSSDLSSLQKDNLINLSGWSVVASWKDENFQMNEHQKAYLENMFASEIFPRVYLGTQMAASDKAWLEDHQITHILTISDFQPNYPESYTCKRISIKDHITQNIITHFDTSYKFIQSALQEEGNILVHCQAGISRSPSVIIAYIMKSHKVSYDDAFNLVHSKRPAISPNSGFQQQLKLYESLGCQNSKTNPKYWRFLVKKWGYRLLLPLYT
ncbi:protein-tyrosine phosphatase-like protein [Glomus cerebriforme]|uniref:protein-tyrosine-phosphatase n=1 Tax=Glomus cerebriforme TaxID=658196 RepID=A0A397TKI4_9GLOM|nr:protein-tyrosine phosphatase-like protein [Glomus cerebriforme]